MRHDPERHAAEYLGGVMSTRKKRAFERHLLYCETCWQEVRAARRGRAIAEGQRMLAPQHVRERLRATVVSASKAPAVGSNRRPPTVAAAALLIIAATALGGLYLFRSQEESRQPRAIQAMVAAYKTERPAAESQVVSRLPERLGDLELVAARTERMAGFPVRLNVYRDRSGHEIWVYVSKRSFPVAAGAEHSPQGNTWSATVRGVRLFCADRPQSSLVVGRKPILVAQAAARLHLR